jgi:hypothetical protein
MRWFCFTAFIFRPAAYGPLPPSIAGFNIENENVTNAIAAG